MNPDLDLTLKYFKPGIEILFPSRDVLETTNFVVDRDAARLFYEVNLYYAAFGQEFNRGTAEIGRLMKARLIFCDFYHSNFSIFVIYCYIIHLINLY